MSKWIVFVTLLFGLVGMANARQMPFETCHHYQKLLNTVAEDNDCVHGLKTKHQFKVSGRSTYCVLEMNEQEVARVPKLHTFDTSSAEKHFRRICNNLSI